MIPGLIDNHTHFDRAGGLILGINLLDVSDDDGLQEQLQLAIQRLPKGAWILGGDWGAYEAWGKGFSGTRPNPTQSAPFNPDRTVIDSVSGLNPVLLSRWDQQTFLANGVAIERSGASSSRSVV